MNRSFYLDNLVVAIGPGVEIGPGDIGGVRIIALEWKVRVDVLAVEVVRRADSFKRADRTTQIHMISRDHQPATEATEVRYGPAVVLGEPVADVHREQPHLVEGASVQCRQ